MSTSSNQKSNLLKAAESMTGYTVLDCELNSKKYRLHLKSVNNKYFDLKWRAPREWLSLEFGARKTLQTEFSRGSFDFWVEEISSGKSKDASAQIYMKKLEQTLGTLKGINQELLSMETAANILSRSPELWFDTEEQKAVEDSVFQEIFSRLLNDLKAERKKEGTEIKKALLVLVEQISREYQRVLEHVPLLKEKLSNDYRERIQDLVNQKLMSETFEGRLQSEILFLLERRDICEELDRIHIHLNKLKELIQNPIENFGKRIDFLGQELNREWSTLGNKIHNTNLFEAVTESKLAIDKIREQSLNLA